MGWILQVGQLAVGAESMLKWSHKAANIWMLLVAVSCYLIQGVIINLLFPWVISPLLVVFLWLKYLRAHGHPGAGAAAHGFLFGASLTLLYIHIDWYLSGAVNRSASHLMSDVFVLAPLQAFSVGALVALLAYFTSRIRHW